MPRKRFGMARQLGFKYRIWGGKRKGAGRKPKGEKPGVSHHVRPPIPSGAPVHVTLRVVAGLPNLRTKSFMRTALKAFTLGCQTDGFRMVHYSVQKNHYHLLIEAKSAASLSRGMQGFSIRLAKAINRESGHRGRVFTDRYHSHILRTPTEVKNVLVYLFGNVRKHSREQRRNRRWVDPCTSAKYFNGWRDVKMRAPPGKSPVAIPKFWLVRKGWRRCGLLPLGAAPAS